MVIDSEGKIIRWTLLAQSQCKRNNYSPLWCHPNMWCWNLFHLWWIPVSCYLD